MLNQKELTHLCFMVDAMVSDPGGSREFLRSLQAEPQTTASKDISEALRAMDTSLSEVAPEGAALTLDQLKQAADQLYRGATSAAALLAGQALHWATDNRAHMENQRLSSPTPLRR